jgi:hypothetical protein
MTVRAARHAILVAVLAAGASLAAGAQGAPPPLVVVGSANPATDRGNVQAAVNRARRTAGGSVRLVGTFNFGNCSMCVVVPGPVTISGVGDPSVPNPDPAKVTTILNAGAASMAVVDTGPSTGKVVIQHLWFKGAKTLAVMALQVRGTLTMRENRISDVQPGNEFRFGIAGAEPEDMPSAIATRAEVLAAVYGSSDGPRLTGAVVLDGNAIDHNLPMARGDDNGVAFAGCHLKSITVSGNTIRAGEAVEIEGCRGTRAVYRVTSNVIVQNPTPSNLAQMTATPGFVRHGGHPAAIKPLDAEASRVIIRGNSVDSRVAPPSAVCVLAGNSNRDSTTLIEGNTCRMNGQFAAILGGWAGTPGFFLPSFLHDATITRNTFRGNALLGVAWLDFTYLRNASQTLVNRASGNVMVANRDNGFRATRAAVDLGPSTSGNRIVEGMRGRVVDSGSANTVISAP